MFKNYDFFSWANSVIRQGPVMVKGLLSKLSLQIHSKWLSKQKSGYLSQDFPGSNHRSDSSETFRNLNLALKFN